MKEKGSLSIETVHYTKDGRGIPVEVNCSYVKYEGHEYSFVSARDISQRKQLEESLLLTQCSVNQAGDLVFWLDGDAKLRVRQRHHSAGNWAILNRHNYKGDFQIATTGPKSAGPSATPSLLAMILIYFMDFGTTIRINE